MWEMTIWQSFDHMSLYPLEAHTAFAGAVTQVTPQRSLRSCGADSQAMVWHGSSSTLAEACPAALKRQEYIMADQCP